GNPNYERGFHTVLDFVLEWLAGQLPPKDLRVPGSNFEYSSQRSRVLRIGSIALVLLTSCLLFQSEANSQLKPVRRVVVFYELGFTSPAVALIDREMRAVLDDSRYQIELYPENLETDLFDSPAEQQDF